MFTAFFVLCIAQKVATIAVAAAGTAAAIKYVAKEDN